WRGAVRDVQGHVFFAQATRSARARIVSAVARVEHDAPHLARTVRRLFLALRWRILGDVDHEPKWLWHVKHVAVGDAAQIQDDARARRLRADAHARDEAADLEGLRALVRRSVDVDEQPRALAGLVQKPD